MITEPSIQTYEKSDLTTALVFTAGPGPSTTD